MPKQFPISIRIQRVVLLRQNVIICIIYFPQNILYILPMKKVKKWFFDNYDDFITKITSTCDVDGVVLYRSLGKLIPRERISKEVPGVRIINLNVKNKKIQD